MKFSPRTSSLHPGHQGQGRHRRQDLQPAHRHRFRAQGRVYVSDGYGNSRVVKISPDGKYLLEWGKKGTAPGEFDIPHSIAVDSKGTSTSATARTTGYRSSTRTASSCASGPIWVRPRTSSSLQGRDVDHHPSRQNREHHLRYAGRPHHAHRMATGGIIGSMESPGHWLTHSQRRDLHRQPYRQRFPLVSRLADAECRSRGGAETG